MVTKADGSVNSLVYGKEGEFACLIFEEGEDFQQEAVVHPLKQNEPMSKEEDEMWNFHFDEANSREGNGASVLLISHKGHLVPLSFNLEYKAINNVAEYEALLLGLQTTKNMNI